MYAFDFRLGIRHTHLNFKSNRLVTSRTTFGWLSWLMNCGNVMSDPELLVGSEKCRLMHVYAMVGCSVLVRLTSVSCGLC